MYSLAFAPQGISKLKIGIYLVSALTVWVSGKFLKRKFGASDQKSNDEFCSSQLGLIAINKKPPGLVNNGNTCFVNSVLQALASMPQFIRNLEKLCGLQESRLQQKTSQSLVLKRRHSSANYGALSQSQLKPSNQIHENSQAICNELLRVLHSLNDDGIGNTEFSFHPTELLRLLENTADYLSFREQQDSHELLKLVIQCFEDTLKAESIRQTDLVGISKKQNTIQNSLLGYTNTYLQCTSCNKTFNSRNEPFYDLSLDILNTSVRSLDDSLRNFFTEELIDGVECLNCSLNQFLNEKQSAISSLKNKQNKEEFLPAINLIQEQIALAKKIGERSLAETDHLKSSINALIAHQINQLDKGSLTKWKQYIQSTFGIAKRQIKKVIKIGKAPQILILHLKRLVINPRTGYPLKIDRSIAFKDRLILEDSLAIKNKNNTKTTYQLSSLISHIGADNFGHYVTLRRVWHEKYQTTFSQNITEANHSKSHWYLTSDTQIRYFDKNDVFEVPAYILFYERVIQ